MPTHNSVDQKDNTDGAGKADNADDDDLCNRLGGFVPPYKSGEGGGG